MNRFVLFVIIALTASVGALRGQTLFSTSFDSLSELNSWYDYQAPMRAWSHRVADGNLYVGFSLEESMTGPDAYAWGTQNERGFGRNVGNTNGPFELTATMFLDSTKFQNYYTWSSNLTLYGSSLVTVGAYDSMASGSPVWRIGTRSAYNAPVVWTDTGVAATQGWHTVKIGYDGANYLVTVDDAVLGSGTAVDLGIAYALSGFAFHQYDVNFPGSAYTSPPWPSYEVAFGSLEVASVAAIPEPSTWAAIVGTLALAAVALRRRKAG